MAKKASELNKAKFVHGCVTTGRYPVNDSRIGMQKITKLTTSLKEK